MMRWGVNLLDIKTYCKATVKNIACDYVIDEQADRRPRIENPKLDLSIYGNIIYDEGSISSNEKRESFFFK